MLLLGVVTTGVITVCYYCGTYQVMLLQVLLLGAVLLGCIYHSSTRDVYTGATTAGYYYTMVCSLYTPHHVLLRDVLL